MSRRRERFTQELRAAMERKGGERERASTSGTEKPVSELTCEEAFARIRDQHLASNYTENKELFKRWWNLLPPEVRNELEVAAEGFLDSSSYLTEFYRSLGAVRGRPLLETFFRDLERSLPRITRPQYDEIVGAIRSGEKVTDRGRQVPKAKHLVQSHLAEYGDAIRREFGLTQGRPKHPPEKLLTISRWMYRGLPYHGAMERWNRKNPNDKFKDEDALKRSISNFRKRRESEAWYLRFLIFDTGFPKIKSLMCPACNGKREVVRPEWKEWAARIGKPNSELMQRFDAPLPATMTCPDCAGAGRRRF